MKKSTAAAAAGAVALTATGAVSALFMTMGAAQSPAAASSEPVVLTEYVDQNGNPVEAPGEAGFEMPEIVVVDAPANDPIVTTQYADTSSAEDASSEAYGAEYEEEDDDAEYSEEGHEDEYEAAGADQDHEDEDEDEDAAYEEEDHD